MNEINWKSWEIWEIILAWISAFLLGCAWVYVLGFAVKQLWQSL